jgi:hypothetical protein
MADALDKGFAYVCSCKQLTALADSLRPAIIAKPHCGRHTVAVFSQPMLWVLTFVSMQFRHWLACRPLLIARNTTLVITVKAARVSRHTHRFLADALLLLLPLLLPHPAVWRVWRS